MFALSAIPIQVLAALWEKAAFEAKGVPAAKSALFNRATDEAKPDDITITVATFAENGAVVPIEIESHLPNTRAIAILVEKNPTALIANYMFESGVYPKIITRIKMAESSDITVIVKTDERYVEAKRFVEVSVGGCG